MPLNAFSLTTVAIFLPATYSKLVTKSYIAKVFLRFYAVLSIIEVLRHILLQIIHSLIDLTMF